jgi:hypothetical protein
VPIALTLSLEKKAATCSLISSPFGKIQELVAWGNFQMSVQQALLSDFMWLWSEPLMLSEGDGEGIDMALENPILDMIAEVTGHSDEEDDM